LLASPAVQVLLQRLNPGRDFDDNIMIQLLDVFGEITFVYAVEAHMPLKESHGC
jgi:hypothetical protein